VFKIIGKEGKSEAGISRYCPQGCPTGGVYFLIVGGEKNENTSEGWYYGGKKKI